MTATLASNGLDPDWGLCLAFEVLRTGACIKHAWLTGLAYSGPLARTASLGDALHMGYWSLKVLIVRRGRSSTPTQPKSRVLQSCPIGV